MTSPVPGERERVLAFAAALVTVGLWASSFIGIRSAARQLSPEALALGRLTIASIALGLLVLVRREPPHSSTQAAWLRRNRCSCASPRFK